MRKVHVTSVFPTIVRGLELGHIPLRRNAGSVPVTTEGRSTAMNNILTLLSAPHGGPACPMTVWPYDASAYQARVRKDGRGLGLKQLARRIFG